MSTFIPRPCDRCGAGTIDSDYNTEQIIEPMCNEFHMAHGAVSWLCFNCRKQWHYVVNDLELAKQYETASFQLEFWKTRIDKNTPDSAIDVGLQLYQEVNDLERKINQFANEWLAGAHD